MQRTAAVILAAGASTRMGQPKQLLQLDERTLLDRAIDTAEAVGCSPVLVVLGAAIDVIKPQVVSRSIVIVHNVDWSLGMGTSIRSGIAELQRYSAVTRTFLLLVDQPLIDADVLLRLDAEQQRSGRTACISAFDGTFGPPVLITRDRFKALAQLPDAAGAKAIWQSDTDQIALIEVPSAKADVDTPSEFEQMKLSSTAARASQRKVVNSRSL